MYVIVGRGGILNVFLALFVYLLYGLYLAAIYLLAAGVFVVLAIGVIIKHLWGKHADRKKLSHPPRPKMSPVQGSRDWSPPK